MPDTEPTQVIPPAAEPAPAATPTAGGGHPVPRPRPFPRVVFAITALWFVVLVLWSVLLPTYRSADEYSHVMGAMYWEHHHSWPLGREPIGSKAVVASLPMVGYDDYVPLTVGAAPDQLPSFAELGDVTRPAVTVTIVQHPPGYYALVGTVASLLPDSTPFALEVWFYRLMSVLLMTPLPLILAAVMRQLTRSRRVAVGAALTPFLVPQLAALGGSVNNDTLLVLGSSLTLLGCARILRGDLRMRTAVLTAGGLAVALLTKAFGLALILVVVLALLVVGWRTRRWRETGVFLGVGLLISAAGLWWWVRNLLVLGKVQPAGTLPPRKAGPLPASDAIDPFVTSVIRYVPERFWAMLSIKGDQQAFPTVVYLVLSAVLAILVLVGLFGARRRWPVLERAVLLAPVILVGLVTTYETWKLTLKTGVPRGLQGRYLFVGFVGLGVLLVFGIHFLLGRRLRRWLPLLIALLGAVFSCLAVLRALGYHWEARGSAPVVALRAMTAWSPLGRFLTVVVVLAALVLGVVVLWRCVVLSRAASGRPYRSALGDGPPGQVDGPGQ